MSDEKEKQSLINVEDTLGLSKPATALVEKLSAGLGGVFASHLAKQQAKALEITNKSNLSDIQARAEYRVACQEIRKQENIESIAKQAAKELSPEASIENIQKMDEDWIAYLFKHCEIISDKDMQFLWARILSGEATKAGTFSKRTFDIVSKLDKKDAELFTTFCQFVWLEQNVTPLPLIYDYRHPIYDRDGNLFSTLQYLQSIGLISMDFISIGILARYYLELQPIRWHYHGTVVTVKPRTRFHVRQLKKEHYILTGRALLTKSGEELFRICGAQRNDEFFNYMIDKWEQEGHNPVIQTPKSE